MDSSPVTVNQRKIPWRSVLAATLLAILAFSAYIPCLKGEYLDWDDQWMIRDNFTIKSTDHGLHEIWATLDMPDYYPLTYTLFWLQWHNGDGKPWVFHAINLLLHVANCLLLWDILRRLKIPGAWLGAALFAVHPINAATAAWIVEQKNTLCMLFGLAALECYLEFLRLRRPFEYLAGLVCFICALLSKAAIVPLPAVLLVIYAWKHGRITRRGLFALVPWFLLSAAFAVLTIWVHHHEVADIAKIDIGSIGVRILRSGWAAWFYLYKIIWPLNLMPIYPRWSVDTASFLAYLPLAGLALGCGLLLIARRRWSRATIMSLAIFLIMLSPVLGFLKMGFFGLSFVADHWLYFALPPITALVAATLVKLPRRLCAMIAAALLVGCFTLTWRRSAIYAGSVALWQDNARKNPAAPVLKNLADSLRQKHEYARAQTLAARAVAIEPMNPLNHLCLASVLRDRGDRQAAIAEYEIVIRLNPARTEEITKVLTELRNVK